MMAQVMVLLAGLLLLSESQASDLADRSTHQDFRSKSDYDKFITPNLNRMKHGNELGASPFTVVDDKPILQSSTQVQNSSDPISLSIFGIGLVSFVTMLGLSLWRALQPATIPTNTVSASGGQVMEMKAQDSNVNANFNRVGWGQLSSQSSIPLTLCYANNPQARKRIKQHERNRVANAAWRSRVRTEMRKTKEALDAGDVDAAKECARVATSTIDRATRRGIYHKNWAARNKSRLSKKVIGLILEKREGKPAAAEPAAAEPVAA